jgi:peptidoglycan/LPS O-acetylase OafA/YrhL
VYGVGVNSHIGELPLVKHAWLGVDFFFVLSGFVIATNYQDRLMNGGVRLRDFLALRLGRLYPLHLFALLAMLLIVLFLRFGASGPTQPTPPPNQFALGPFIANLLLIHGLHIGRSILWNQWNHPSWSVSAELVTYMVFACSWRYLRSYSWLLTGLTIVAAPAIILAVHGSLDVSFDLGLFRAMLGFALGVLVFSVARNGMVSSVFDELTATEATIAELVISAAAVALVWISGATPLSMVAPYLFAGVVLLFTREKGIVTRALKTRPLQALGRWSYSIYMLHYPLQLVIMYVALWIGTHGGRALFAAVVGRGPIRVVLGYSPFVGDAANVIMMALLIGASAFTYRAIEEPWRERVRAWVYGGRRTADDGRQLGG